MDQKIITTIQEIYFDISDAIESGGLEDIRLNGFSEFETILEFLNEQRVKLENLEITLTEG